MTSDVYKDGTYLKNNPEWHAEDSEWKAAQIIKMLKMHNITNLKTICEVGCGAGRILKELSEKYDNNCCYEGYDISSQAISLCENIASDNLKF